MRNHSGGLLLAALLLALLAGCRQKAPPAPINYSQPLPPGELALRRIPLNDYPDFSDALIAPNQDLALIGQSIDNSLAYLSRPSSRQFFPYLDITHDRAVATLHAMKAIIAAQADPMTRLHGSQLNNRFREMFEVYKSKGGRLGNEYSDTVLFTGYFTPIYDASLSRGGMYQWPLYRRPADLISDEETGETRGRRTPEGIVPYHTRAEIESRGLLAEQELVWLKSRFDAYIITVQGSARLRLPDGRIMEIGYNGNNGYDYRSPGRQMVADGVIREQDLNLRAMRGYFESHPDAMDRYLWLNQRYVFFTERPGGPFGSLNVPVSPFATIATDKNVYPRSMPALVVAPIPSSDGKGTIAFKGFMMDQDTGGAIRAAGRCDIYMGLGEDAERLAGRQLNEGELYYLALRPEYVSQYLNPPPDDEPE